MLFVAFILSASQISKDAPWPRRYCASALRNVVLPTRWRPTTIIRTGLRSSLSVSKGIQPFPFSVYWIVQVQNSILLPVLEAQRQHRHLDVLSRLRAQARLLPGLLHAGPHEDVQVQGFPLKHHDHRRIDGKVRPLFADDRREIGDGLWRRLTNRSPRLNLGERGFVSARHPRRHIASRILRTPEGAFGFRLRFLRPQSGLLFANALPRFARRLRFDCGPVNRGQPCFGEPAAKPRPGQPDAGPSSLNGKLVVMLEQPPEERRSERRARHHR